MGDKKGDSGAVSAYSICSERRSSFFYIFLNSMFNKPFKLEFSTSSIFIGKIQKSNRLDDTSTGHNFQFLVLHPLVSISIRFMFVCLSVFHSLIEIKYM